MSKRLNVPTGDPVKDLVRKLAELERRVATLESQKSITGSN
jgi:hypothetical protein